MHIAIFTDAFMPQVSGVVTATLSLAEGLARSHQVTLFVPKARFSYHRKNIRVVPVPGVALPSYKDIRLCIPPTRSGMKIFEDNPPDVIIVTSFGGIGIGGVRIAKKIKAPCIGISHTFFDLYLKHTYLPQTNLTRRLVGKTLARFYNQCTHIVAPSRVMRDALVNWGTTSPITIISNPLDLRAFRHRNATRARKKYHLPKKTVVYLGRMSYEKNPLALLDAFRIVTQKIPHSRLLMIGDGPSLNQLKQKAKEISIDNATTFTGFLNGQQKIDALSCGRVFCSASESENQPISLLEAEACGIPLVGVDALGVGEIITNNANGLKVKPGDTEGLAKCIITILQNEKKYHTLRKGAMRHAAQRSAEKIQKEWERIIRKAAI